MNIVTWPMVGLVAIAAFTAVAVFGVCSFRDDYAWGVPGDGGWTAYPAPSAQAERCHNFWLSPSGLDYWTELLDSVYMLNDQLGRFPDSSADHLEARRLAETQLGLVSVIDAELSEYCWWQ
ncbi:MAG: hypothetical protein F4Y69_06365 [Chloroflexi bacterium]|nr:hypothetical protein [Chloroflexota bacterium]MYF21875.1 hypothetical protein [Chloroflexota bacterium]